jgi:uncharacterized protein YbjT (DUF2867 family)
MGDADARVILLAGATGLVGSCTLEALLEANDVSRVLAVTRRPLQREHSRLANRIVQFEKIEAQLKGVSCDAALCCLGSTRRQAGSRERFRQVDVEAVLAFARVAQAGGAKRFVVISSVGADPNSRNFYLRTKGDMEEELEGLAFESLDILQPSLLMGWRSEMRPLELVGLALMPLVNPLLGGKYANYRGISARTVAAAMLGAVRSGRRGVNRYTYAGIEQLARLTSARARALPQPKASARAR